MNGQYHTKDGSYIIDATDEHQVYVWNSCTKVEWDYKHTVKVTTEKWCAERATGVCGNCDGNKTNDKVTSNGEYVGDEPDQADSVVTSWWQSEYGEDEAK